MSSKWKIISLIFCLVAVSFLSYKVGVYVEEQKMLGTPPFGIIQDKEEIPEKVDFSIFWETWRKLEKNFLYKGKIDYGDMTYGAIEGMVNSVEDPYTTFFTPTETEGFEEVMSGKYQGVGMEIAIKDDKIIVISPFEGTPAKRAGIKPEDEILEVNGTSTKNLTVEETAGLIKGPEGTKVQLLIQRNAEEPFQVSLTREVIKIPTLKLEFKEDDIVVVKIYQFNRLLSSEFEEKADEIAGAKKIILDLRNNPGGYLEVAQDIAGWFLPRGKVVAWEDFGGEKGRKACRAKGPARFADYPMVVLINKGSASGSEILAGALRDNRDILLIGETSFGKGLVQKQVSLSDGSSLKVTNARWLTPDGNSINDQGLTPNIEVETTEEDQKQGLDPQLEKAIEILKSS